MTPFTFLLDVANEYIEILLGAVISEGAVKLEPHKALLETVLLPVPILELPNTFAAGTGVVTEAVLEAIESPAVLKA